MSPNGRPGAARYQRLPNYALRLTPWLMFEARKLAKSERISLNQFINMCVAEKIAAFHAAEDFHEALRRIEYVMAVRMLERAEQGGNSLKQAAELANGPQASGQTERRKQPTPYAGKPRRQFDKINSL